MIRSRIASILLLLVALSPNATANDVRVYVLAGSSNSVGYGCDAALLPPELSGLQADVPFWFEDGVLTDGPWVTSGGALVPLQPQVDSTGIVFGGVSTGFGPEISAGRMLADGSTDPIAIVKVGSDGSSLAYHWHPDAGGRLFGRMLDAVNAAEAQLRDLGHTPVLSGFVWMQGEVDAQNQAHAARYRRNLERFIRQVRRQLDAPTLPFVLGRPSANIVCGSYGCFPYLTEVRDAQAVVALALPGISIVDTDDLTLQPDGAHFTAASQLQLGQRFASALLAP